MRKKDAKNIDKSIIEHYINIKTSLKKYLFPKTKIVGVSNMPFRLLPTANGLWNVYSNIGLIEPVKGIVFEYIFYDHLFEIFAC